MSSILKALKKLEEERSLKSGGTVDVRRAHLATASTGVSSRWRFPVLIGCTVIIAVVVTLLLVRFLGTAVPVQPFIAPPVSRIAPASTPATLPTPGLEQPGSASPVVADRPRLLSPENTPPLPLKSVSTVPPAPSISQPAPLPAPSTVTAPVPVPLPQPLAAVSLRVTGIAWQPEGGDRMAMVNGQAVSEGGSVAGAKVVEILRDRVRFLRDGQQLDVPLER